MVEDCVWLQRLLYKPRDKMKKKKRLGLRILTENWRFHQLINLWLVTRQMSNPQMNMSRRTVGVQFLF